MVISIDPLVATVTALMAGGLIGLGWWQIRALRQQIKRIDESATLAERANRAELIVRLNAIHEEMIGARRDAWNTMQQCEKLHPNDKAKCYQAMGEILGALRTSDKKADLTRYYNLHKIMDFGELIGFLVIERKLLTLDDVRGLWGTSLKTWAKWFGVYIANLQQEYPDAYILLLKLVRKL
jgi:hypothetical protein